jgi:hypothetical protein
VQRRGSLKAQIQASGFLIEIAGVEEEGLALQNDAQVLVDLGEEFGKIKLLKRT